MSQTNRGKCAAAFFTLAAAEANASCEGPTDLRKLACAAFSFIYDATCRDELTLPFGRIALIISGRRLRSLSSARGRI